MSGFTQTNDLTEMFNSNLKRQSSADLFSEIDEIMKHEQDDDISLEDPLSSTPIDLDLDSISDFLEPPRSTSSSFSQQLNINGLSLSFNNHANLQSSNTSAYSSSDASPRFVPSNLTTTTNHFPQFFHSNTSQPSPYVFSQENPNFLATRSFDFSTNNNGPYDVKRFRSASMNDGPSLYHQANKLEPQFLDPFRFKSSIKHANPPPAYQQPKPASLTDPSANPNWPFVGCSRPASSSFSEVDSHQQQQQRLNPLSELPLSTLQYRNPSRFSQQTLYSINQSTSGSNKHLSLPEIKDDPTSPTGTIEQQSEADLWSDIEQNSSDLIVEHDNTSDDETTTSVDYSKVSERSTSPPRFWKYNVQSKGPKTKRMLYLKERDPHLHREFSDPVYQIKLTQTNGQTFNKLRKGDGNDVTPNPMKLYQLGKQIRDLLKNTSSLYQGIYHVDHHRPSANDSVEVKKEKNKLASKTCRLRKKAQHEANKLKLHGLNEEHKSLIDIIASIKLVILQQYDSDVQPSTPKQSLEAALDQIIATKYSQSVAGNSDGFVEATVNEMENLYSQKSA